MIEAGKDKAYDVDSRIPEIYDLIETQTEDISLIRVLIGDGQPLRILEAFCGNGRILIPLAKDGHTITGLDKSEPMLSSLHHKIEKLPESIRENITIIRADVLSEEWPQDFDVVILGGNCFYELATLEEQEKCVSLAREALKPNGYLYLDNDHMEGDLDQSWRETEILENMFPTGQCSDGTRVKGTTQTIWYDAKNRLARSRRTVEVTNPDGKVFRKEWVEQCHAPSTIEMKEWLAKNGFEIESLWGDRKNSPYTDTSPRAIFWARLIEK